MEYFHHPGVQPNFLALKQLAQAPGFLNTPGVHHNSPEINKVIQNTRLMGYDINPLDRPPAGYGTSALAHALYEIANAQNPYGSAALNSAINNANSIIARANLATQKAAVQPAIRLIGGLAVWGLREGTWSDEIISKLAPDQNGHILLRRTISGPGGYDTRVVVRELANDDVPEKNDKECFHPDILVRTQRFGAVSVEFGRGDNRVGFTTQKRTDNLSVTMSQGEGRRKTEFTITEGEPEFLHRHEDPGKAFMAVTNEAEKLTVGRRNEVRPIIAATMQKRNVLPQPVDDPPRKKRWIF